MAYFMNIVDIRENVQQLFLSRIDIATSVLSYFTLISYIGLGATTIGLMMGFYHKGVNNSLFQGYNGWCCRSPKLSLKDRHCNFND